MANEQESEMWEEVYKKKSCNVRENVIHWPYEKRCRNSGTHTLVNSMAEDLDMITEDGEYAQVCDYHWEVLQRAGWVV